MVDAGVATVWLIPLAPTTTPASPVGTERSLSARRSARPPTECSDNEVSKACSTCAAVPDTPTSRRSADTEVVVRPCWVSQEVTVATWSAVGEHRDSHWAAVRNWW